MDLLTMLLLSEAVSPALTGGDETVTGGMIAAALLIGLGKVNSQLMRSERITDADLRSALHQHGLMNVGDVARAFVEARGEITIVKRKDLEESRERFHAHAS